MLIIGLAEVMGGAVHFGTGTMSHSLNNKVFSVLLVQPGFKLLQATVYIHELIFFAEINPCICLVILIAGSGGYGHVRYSLQFEEVPELFIHVLVTTSFLNRLNVLPPLSIITGKPHDTVHDMDTKTGSVDELRQEVSAVISRTSTVNVENLVKFINTEITYLDTQKILLLQ